MSTNELSATGGKGGLAYIAEQLRPLALPIDTLKPDPANARKHDQRNLDAIAASLSRFGQRAPIVVQREGMIVRAGNGRLAAAKSLGWSHMAAVVVDDASIDAVAFAIADNRTAELAEWDDETLAALLNTMPASDLADTGFTEDELKELLSGLSPEIPEDVAPEPLPDAVSKAGDLWLVGDHRLLCGDSTDPASWSLLHIGSGCVCFTSPPYNLGSSISLSGNTSRASSGSAYTTHTDRVSKYAEMLSSISKNALDHCECAIMNVQPVAGCKADLLRWIGDHAGSICDIVTWDKGAAQPPMAEGVLASRYEWLVILSQKTPATRRVPLSSWRGTLSAVYSGPPQRNNEYAAIHGATFPVHLPSYVMSDLCNRSAGVVDCFMGTGTSIVAAEQLGRKCYGIEMDPIYVDVAVRRWEKLTGKGATLESTGKTWAETAKERGVNV